MRLLSRTDFEHGLKEWLNGSIASASEINAAGVKTVHPADWQLREEVHNACVTNMHLLEADCLPPFSAIRTVAFHKAYLD